MAQNAAYHKLGTENDVVTPDFGIKKLAILGSSVLVTGVTGFIGNQVANQLLKAGYRVRGTTRSASKGKLLTELFGKQYASGYFELVEVSDMSKPETWTEDLKNFSGIAHIASDFSLEPDPNKIATPTVQNVTAPLTAASKTSTVKRFVYTSDSTAITAPRPNKSSPSPSLSGMMRT